MCNLKHLGEIIVAGGRPFPAEPGLVGRSPVLERNQQRSIARGFRAVVTTQRSEAAATFVEFLALVKHEPEAGLVQETGFSNERLKVFFSGKPPRQRRVGLDVLAGTSTYHEYQRNNGNGTRKRFCKPGGQ